MPWIPQGTIDNPSDGNFDLTLSDPKDFVQSLHHIIPSGGTVGMGARIAPPDSGNVYANRISKNGVNPDTTSINNSLLGWWTGATSDEELFTNMLMLTISGEEKLVIIDIVGDEGDLASDVPNKIESSGKSTNTVQCNKIRMILGAGTGVIGAGSNSTAFGSD